MNKPNILLATPTYNSIVSVAYLHSLLQLVNSSDFSITVETLDTTELYRARSYFAGKFFQNKAFTHLLFVDSDMRFKLTLLKKMIEFDKPFIAALCPKKSLDENGNLQFVCSENIVKIHGNFAQMSRIGTGISLFKREVFEKISCEFPSLNCSDKNEYFNSLGLYVTVNQCFAPVTDQSGNIWSEDLSFCWRWIQCGGEIWACIDEHITHVGVKNYTGAYLSSLDSHLKG